MIRVSTLPALCLTALMFCTADSAWAETTDNYYAGLFGTTLDFATDGTVVYTEEEEDAEEVVIETFEGTYTWKSRFGIQLITLELEDFSDNGVFNGTGFGIGGVILSIGYTNPDFTTPWGDIYFKSTPPAARSSGPTEGAKGGR